MRKQDLLVIAKSALIYSFAYLIVGAIAYQLLTKQFYVGDNPIFTAYLRSESNPSEWAHTNTWIFPGLLLRSTLISFVLFPFFETLKSMRFPKRTLVIFALMFILTHIAAAAPSPSNIEGLIYMKPALVNPLSFLLTQPEMVVQTAIYAVGLSWILNKR